MIDAETLRALLDYDPETGVFTNRFRRSHRAPKGCAVGGRNGPGYTLIRLNGRTYLAHRLAWLWVHGRWPADQLDHINGIRNDNRISNLREACNAQNCANRRVHKNNRIGVKGVFELPSGNFGAKVRDVYLGSFATEQEAHDAYCAAAAKEFGAYHRAG